MLNSQKTDSSLFNRIISGEEVWVPVREYGKPHYASSNGRIKKVNIKSSLTSGRLCPLINCGGRISAYIPRKISFVHRVVFSSFYNMDIPDGYQTDHIGSNPLNNSVLNLRLCNGTLDNARGNYNTLQEHNSIGVSMKPIIKIDNLEGGVWVPVL